MEKKFVLVLYKAVCYLAWGCNGKASKFWRYDRNRVRIVRADVTALAQTELQLPVSQALALFVKLLRKISCNLQEIQRAAVSATILEPTPRSQDGTGATISLVADAERGLKNMEAELDAAGDEATTALQEKQRAIIDSLDLSR